MLCPEVSKIDSPAFMKVRSGVFERFFIQIPHPHSSHHARSRVLPLTSLSILCVLGSGDPWVSMFLVSTNM